MDKFNLKKYLAESKLLKEENKNDLREWQDKFNATIYNIDPKKWVDQKSFQDDLNSFVDEAIRASDLDLVQDIMNATKNVSEYASRSLRTYKNL